MVLENLINPIKAEQHPFSLFFIGLVFSAISIFLSYAVFGTRISIIMIILIMIACIPLVFHTMRLEEKKDIMIEDEGMVLKEHAKAVSFFTFLFLGFVVSFALVYIFLPSNLLGNVFEVQIKTIDTQNMVTASAISPFGAFSAILFNNLKVMTFSYLLSFFYGAGAIVILAWNASLIGVAIGNFFRQGMEKYGSLLVPGLSQVHVFSLSLIRYLVHGIPEMAAFLIAGLAGGILSFAVIRHHLKSEKFNRIFRDSLDLIVISIFVLFVSALIEVFIVFQVF